MRAKYVSYDKRKQPEEISKVIGSVIENATVNVDVRQGELVAEWNTFVPQDWTRGTPIGVRDGILLVTVSDGASASLLRYQERALLTAIQGRFGNDVCTRIRLKVVPTKEDDGSGTAQENKGL
jgi:predicted nucleic acid-binding Zn ribbon protein